MMSTDVDKVFKDWSKWYWPCHFILHSVFLSKIPESFLPYPRNVLEGALNAMAKQYYDNGDLETPRSIQGSIAFLGMYVKDEEALEQASQTFSNPKLREIVLLYISNYKKDWIKWLDK